MREPTVFWGPGIVEPRIVRKIGTTLDLLPTIASITQSKLPPDRTLDGYDLMPVLKGGDESPRDEMFYYHGEQVFAILRGDFKAHFKTKTSYVGQREAVVHDPPLLFHLGHDPGEKHNIAAAHPELVSQLQKMKATHEASVRPVENQLEKRIRRAAGKK